MSPRRHEPTQEKGARRRAGAARLADLRAVSPGRPRGGLTTRPRAVCVARGLPNTLKPAAGQAQDGCAADDMVGSVAPRQTLSADAARGNDHPAAIGARSVVRPIPHRPDPPPEPDRAVPLEAQARQGHRHRIRNT